MADNDAAGVDAVRKLLRAALMKVLRGFDGFVEGDDAGDGAVSWRAGSANVCVSASCRDVSQISHDVLHAEFLSYVQQLQNQSFLSSTSTMPYTGRVKALIGRRSSHTEHSMSAWVLSSFPHVWQCHDTGNGATAEPSPGSDDDDDCAGADDVCAFADEGTVGDDIGTAGRSFVQMEHCCFSQWLSYVQDGQFHKASGWSVAQMAHRVFVRGFLYVQDGQGQDGADVDDIEAAG
jgi:hypothetical protein